ncbi:MAG TPA: DUF6036 family nucleotidyltransferase [Longimicrobium sp.]|jgi:hypothetical protein
MPDAFGKEEILGLLEELGHFVRGPATLVLAGSAALILRDQLNRATVDIDVIESRPDLGQLQEAIRGVERSAGAPAGWVSSSIQSYIDVLPPDYRRRVEALGTFGAVRVELVGRLDLIVMKLWGGTRRARDLQDLHILAPSFQELDFASGQVERLRSIDAARAERMEKLIQHFRGDAPPPGDR